MGYSHFAEENETQWDWVTCPKTQLGMTLSTTRIYTILASREI